MSNSDQSLFNIMAELKERAKELSCLYKVDEIINNHDFTSDKVLEEIVKAIPVAWQYPEICVVKITMPDKIYTSENFTETIWKQSADIIVLDKVIGHINIYYTEQKSDFDEGPFLKEERKLLDSIAGRISNYLLHNKLKHVFTEMQSQAADLEEQSKQDKWKIALDLLQDTDQNLYKLIARKMINYLSWSGVKEAEDLLFSYTKTTKDQESIGSDFDNMPIERIDLPEFDNRVFRIASEHLSDDEILYKIQKWMQEEKASFLVRTLENHGATLQEITDAIRRYLNSTPDDSELAPSVKEGLNVSLIRRFLSDQLNFISIAKNYVDIEDFYFLLQRMIYPVKSQGKIGGKSVGVFIANKILKKSKENQELFKDIKIPKTWYITTDAIIEFLHYNNLEEVIEQKYKDLDQIRQEYPAIVQVFKNSSFPPEIVKALSVALDDFGNHPLIVRSSSLLEDRLGSAFAGKYKSLFVVNQGPKQKRLNELLEAIAEVYSSVFNTDPIEYRSEKGLLDFNEEMGIMIQEVVGTRVGKYFLPTYAGVAFSNNEFRWSPRINREDGLVRVVPGLGTRAVDRIGDDYPILFSPGKPGLRVNVTLEETIRYSPKKIDVLDLESGRFETLDIDELIRLYGDVYPFISQIVSVLEQGQIKKVVELNLDTEKDDLIVTFDRLVDNTSFLKRMGSILKVLKEKLNTPVDVEFASDGNNFYLLQCRPQFYSKESFPAPIPRDIPEEKIIFTANKYVSNGQVPDITHIVYVSPEKYNEISDLDELKEIGRIIGRLNKLLPKRQFILMGPGRWGSRGDIKLGVNVSYSDINNTAVLIEIARKTGNYLPDLSFGTHFFQDLVESSIRYLPLYPDEPEVIFNERFLKSSENILSLILPEFKHFSDIVNVIDIPRLFDNMTLKLLMNADLDEAIAFISTQISKQKAQDEQATQSAQKTEDYWKWRLRMAENIAAHIDAVKFGVQKLYIFGSTKNATAGPGSDIDLLIHFLGDSNQKEQLLIWLNGWSLCLSELNFLRTGYKTAGLLDVHIITDEDIKNKNSYAMKINAVTDAARELQLKK
jgi:pyruvate, water dikinase